MAVTKDDILSYICNTPANTNPGVLGPMLDEYAKSDGPDLSGITATASDILVGKKSVDTTGNEVVGTCAFNATVPDTTSAVFAAATDIAKDKQALVLIEGVWTLITGTAE